MDHKAITRMRHIGVLSNELINIFCNRLASMCCSHHCCSSGRQKVGQRGQPPSGSGHSSRSRSWQISTSRGTVKRLSFRVQPLTPPAAQSGDVAFATL